jgi:hypothetical protein
MGADIVTLTPNRMSEAQYDTERSKLAPTKQQAGVRWEQELCLLFARSGWTQAELAAKEGKSQKWVSTQLLFGRFLANIPMGISPGLVPKDLTERRFRNCWGQTSGANERQRFAKVMQLLQEEKDVKIRPTICKDLIEAFGDGRWHPIEEMATKFDVDTEYVASTLVNMNKLNSSGANNERKQVGKSFHYRIFRREKTVSLQELTTKLGPLVDRLKHEGKKRVEAAAPAIVASIAFEIQKIIDEWSK